LRSHGAALRACFRRFETGFTRCACRLISGGRTLIHVTTLILIRHGSHALLGKALAGRAPGLRLNVAGQHEAHALARSLAGLPISAIYSSPRERSRDTAAPLERLLNTKARLCAALDEIDFGEWTGRSLDALRTDPAWVVWVEKRGLAQPPGGEAFANVQRRVVSGIEELCRLHPNATVALFSHGDVIKAALAHVMRMSLNDLECLDIAPASLSVIVKHGAWAQVRLVNGSALGSSIRL
jgi:probable phosphoglycerate mutase